ncbi:hypothetical protein JHK85_025575 [Glycine max]|nr:hypothetical protein JHK85_025575 [Glycine max]
MSSYFEERAPCCGTHFWILLSMCSAFVLFAAITSGLSLGLLSFSQVDLEVLVKAGQPKIQKNAAKIMSIVKNEHLLLCTLLIAKSMALELLDWLFGKGHTALLGRAELKTLVHLHAIEAGKGGELSLHETRIIAGALDLTQKTAKDAMTPISETFSLDINSKLDMVGEDWPLYDILNQFKKGQSHMAVVLKCGGNIRTAATGTEGNTPVVAVDFVGHCPSFEPGDHFRISTDASNWHSQETEYYSATLKSVMHREGDSDLLQRRSEQPDASSSFENLESLSTEDEEVIGIITLEDVMEELLQYQNQTRTCKKSVIRVLQKGFKYSSTTEKFRCISSFYICFICFSISKNVTSPDSPEEFNIDKWEVDQ